MVLIQWDGTRCCDSTSIQFLMSLCSWIRVYQVNGSKFYSAVLLTWPLKVLYATVTFTQPRPHTLTPTHTHTHTRTYSNADGKANWGYVPCSEVHWQLTGVFPLQSVIVLILTDVLIYDHMIKCGRLLCNNFITYQKPMARHLHWTQYTFITPNKVTLHTTLLSYYMKSCHLIIHTCSYMYWQIQKEITIQIWSQHSIVEA